MKYAQGGLKNASTCLLNLVLLVSGDKAQQPEQAIESEVDGLMENEGTLF